jgi:hypothetical protein
MLVQVLTLMPLRTTMNFQVRTDVEQNDIVRSFCAPVPLPAQQRYNGSKRTLVFCEVCLIFIVAVSIRYVNDRGVYQAERRTADLVDFTREQAPPAVVRSVSPWWILVE